MNLFGRFRDPRPTPDHVVNPPLPVVDGIDLAAAAEEEFRIADAVAGPILDRLRITGTILTRVDVDADRGSADLTFADGTVIRCATQGEEIHQLRAAARLVDTRLTVSVIRDDAPGRVLVFTSASWTVYLVVNVAVARR